MGWNSAGGIFDAVAEALIEQNASPEMKRKVLGKLISYLQSEDWDTLDESAEQFRHDPAIVGLFVERGVTLKCEAKDGPAGTRMCERRLGHRGDHVDGLDENWPQKSGSN